jgi:hypothetical protein
VQARGEHRGPELRHACGERRRPASCARRATTRARAAPRLAASGDPRELLLGSRRASEAPPSCSSARGGRAKRPRAAPRLAASIAAPSCAMLAASDDAPRAAPGVRRRGPELLLGSRRATTPASCSSARGARRRGPELRHARRERRGPELLLGSRRARTPARCATLAASNAPRAAPRFALRATLAAHGDRRRVLDLHADRCRVEK